MKFIISFIILFFPIFAINKDISLELVSFFEKNYGIKLNLEEDNLYLFFQVKKWLRTPFKMYSTDKLKGIGEIELMNEIYKNAYCRDIPENIQKLKKEILFKKNLQALQQGDFLFFSHNVKFTHLGIYLKDGYFIHVDSLYGVKLDLLENLGPELKLVGGGKLPCKNSRKKLGLEDFLIDTE